MNSTSIQLHPGREASVHRNHHWIFSGAVRKINGDVKDGDLVVVLSSSGATLGYGHYSPSNITVRMLQFGPSAFSATFWKDKIQSALELRKRLDLVDNLHSNAYRLIHGEGDGLPGLVIDIYAGHAVIQCHSPGMYRAVDEIAAALHDIYANELKAIYHKSKESLGASMPTASNAFLFGDAESTVIRENGHEYLVNWVTGQKTGFFLDQRDNRKLLGTLCRSRSVLNLFAYSGGFSVYALAGGASLVDSVDVSQTAIDLLNQNMDRVQGVEAPHQSFATPVNEFIKDCGQYDVIVCDPPAFAKSLSKRHQALIGYKNLNAKVLMKVRSGGFLLTFSCSQVMDRELFQQTLLAAALESGRKVRILQHLGQGPDHPVNIYHPEGAYLKGLLLYVD